jgi:hypothetical protein
MVSELVGLFAIYLASESIRFDANLRPRFSEHQIASTSASTRDGLAKWAGTAEGRAIIGRVLADDHEVTIVEDATEAGVGRAPQPMPGVLLAAEDAAQLKRYELILNPSIAALYNNPAALDLGLPRTPADVMAAAWAAEMLHIDFYSRGISLPHHDRHDFQERWMKVAGQLGFGRMTHGVETDTGEAKVITLGEPERPRKPV